MYSLNLFCIKNEEILSRKMHAIYYPSHPVNIELRTDDSNLNFIAYGTVDSLNHINECTVLCACETARCQFSIPIPISSLSCNTQQHRDDAGDNALVNGENLCKFE